MDDQSKTKRRLIDFGSAEREYDAVPDLPEKSNNSQSAQKQPQSAKIDNSKRQSIDLPPELPTPKQKSVKNSKTKSKSKSKIPRSPSLASSLNSSSASGGGGGNGDISYHQQLSLIPPQTPPLPVNFQSKVKHMNGSTIATPSSNSNNSNSHVFGGDNVGPVNGNSNSIMGGGVQLSVGANGANSANGGNHHQQQQPQIHLHTSHTPQRANSSMSSVRRPQLQISPIPESPKHFQYLTLTVRKDENGYGMKVSGDNPVFVESVKPGGAAQIAGLVAGDMILKVNGQEVRSEKHPTVVSLIKASTIVELAVKRSQKMVRPSSVGIVPSTPILSGRDRTASITGPQPVDSIKRREMETHKIQTLQKMLEQERLNLERLKGDTNNASYKLSEANIRTLKEQLRQVGAEDAPTIKYQPTANNKNIAMLSPNQIHHLSASSHHQHHNLQQQQQAPHHHHLHHQATTPQPQPQSSPAFLSLLPRSLSSLSLGTRKNKIDKDSITSPLNNTTDYLHTSTSISAHNAHNIHNAGNNNSPTPPYNMSQSLHQQQRHSPLQLFYQQQQQLQQQQQQQQLLQQRLKDTPKTSGGNSKSKNKFASQPKNLIQEDIPPPLPQRNPPRPHQLDAPSQNSNNNNSTSSSNNNSGVTVPSPHLISPISDLDHASPQRNSPQPAFASSTQSSAQKKRSKTKTKALSDPKMSTQMFLQMESGCGIDQESDGIGGLIGTACSAAFEVDCIPPPLPPRQPGMLEESHKGSFQNLNASSATGTPRPPPNSIETLLNYPLVSTCTAVLRDNMPAAFPLSQRPNIVQQLQQHQQQQQQQQQQLHASGCSQGGTAALGQTPHNINQMNKHRRVVSSPENMRPRNPGNTQCI